MKKIKKISAFVIFTLSLAKVCYADVIVGPEENLFYGGNFIALAIVAGVVVLGISLICWRIIRRR